MPKPLKQCSRISLFWFHACQTTFSFEFDFSESVHQPVRIFKSICVFFIRNQCIAIQFILQPLLSLSVLLAYVSLLTLISVYISLCLELQNWESDPWTWLNKKWPPDLVRKHLFISSLWQKESIFEILILLFSDWKVYSRHRLNITI